jgi:hypothetical protein
MREWNLKAGDPLVLTLAADARLGPTNYGDDQIWELALGSGEPPALALQTTFGLRARSFRLFPRFSEGNQALTDPASFARQPSIQKLYPNYLLIRYSPYSLIDVEAEYWVPDSNGVAGRLFLWNRDNLVRQIRLEWIAQLTPTEGQRMAPREMQAAPVLAGMTGGLVPVVFATGGQQPGTGSYPSLRIDFDLAPGERRCLTWSEAARSTVEESFNLARGLASRPWEAEIARLELLNAGQIDIRTGDPDWDAAFALAQKTAFSLFVGPTDHLPAPSFVYSRQPDQGFSLRGDGSDYNYLWNGQSPLEAVYLAKLVLPGAPHLAQGLVRNFLAVQAENGSVDWKPGLGGQRSRILATPILASLALRIFETNGDREFLDEVFPKLWRFVQAWFSADQDRDGDGIPEWDHPIQTGLDDHPVFSHWHAWSQGVEITTAESPALCALLLRECESLMEMAEVLNHPEPISALRTLSDHLRTAIESSWDPVLSIYPYWDRDTHHSPIGEQLGERLGSGNLEIEREFEPPARFQVLVETTGEATRQPQVIVQGLSASGQPRLETLTKDKFKWYLGAGRLTGERAYSRIEKLEVNGLEAEDRVIVSTVNFRDQDETLLLPLWARVPDKERAGELIHGSILSETGFWRPYGLPACPHPEHALDETAAACRAIHLPWNTLVGEGLVAYGYRSEAAELVMRLMQAILPSLKGDHAFRRYYDAETGQGFGERNALSGLAPLSLFLETLGVRLISPLKIALAGFNPFPWPVTVKYRGTTILRQRESSMVIFPDGQTVSVDDPAPRVVSLE